MIPNTKKKNKLLLFCLFVITILAISFSVSALSVPSGYSTNPADYLMALDFEDQISHSDGDNCTVQSGTVANGTYALQCPNPDGMTNWVGAGNFTQTSSDFICEWWGYIESMNGENFEWYMGNNISGRANSLFDYANIYYHSTVPNWGGHTGAALNYYTPNWNPATNTGAWHHYRFHVKNNSNSWTQGNLSMDYVPGTNYQSFKQTNATKANISYINAFGIKGDTGGGDVFVDTVLCYTGTTAPAFVPEPPTWDYIPPNKTLVVVQDRLFVNFTGLAGTYALDTYFINLTADVVTIEKDIEDIDTGGTNWDGGTASNDEAITGGGWTNTEGTDIFDYANDGQDYDGDGFAIHCPSGGGSPRYVYTNSSNNFWNATIMFYDDASDTSMYMAWGINGEINSMGIVTGTSTTEYVHNNAAWTTTGVTRTTGWHNFTFQYTGSTVNYFIDGTLVTNKAASAAKPTSIMLYDNGGGDCPTCYWDYTHFWNWTEVSTPQTQAFTIQAKDETHTFCQDYNNAMWCDDFEDNDITDWTQTTDATVTGGSVIEGTYALDLQGATPSVSKAPTTTLIPNENGFNMSMNVSLGEPASHYHMFCMGKGLNNVDATCENGLKFFIDGTQGETCTMDGGNRLCYYNDSTATTTGYDYSDVKYMETKYYMNNSKCRFALYINGNFVASEIAPQGDACTDLSWINISFSSYTYTTGSAQYYDNMLVYNSSTTDNASAVGGTLQNNTNLSIGTYYINVSLNDTGNNIISTIYQVTVEEAGFPPVQPSNSYTANFTLAGDNDGTLTYGTSYNTDQWFNLTHLTDGKRARFYGLFSAGNVDLTNFTINTSATKTVINVSGTSGLGSNHTIYVPNVNSEGIYICPNAEKLNDVNVTCPSKIIFSQAEADAGTWKSLIYVKVEGSNFRIDNLTGSGGGDDGAAPRINFTSPTPGNNTFNANGYFTVNVSIAESQLSEVIYNWNGTNYTMYNDSLVLMMNFDNRSALGENDTWVADHSKYGNNATSTAKVNTTDCKYGNCVTFDGTNYVEINNKSFANFTTSDSFTVSIWINATLDGTDRSFIGREFGGSKGWHMRKQSNNEVRFGIVSGGTQYRYSDTSTLTGGWTHIVGVYNAGATRSNTYVNGILDTTLVESGSMASIDADLKMRIGDDGGTLDNFIGQIDEVRIWNRTLTAAEINQQYMSNLYKFNQTQWYLYVNQSKNASTILTDGAYTYQTFASDVPGNQNSTEQRTINIDTTAPNTTFVPPTPDDASSQSSTTISVNVSVNDTYKNVSSFINFDNSTLAWWRFDDVDGSGDPTDYFGTHDGTLQQTAAINSFGKFGNSLLLDGNSDYVNIPDNDKFSFTYGNGTDKPFSFSLWVYNNNIANEAGILSKWGTSGEYLFYTFDSELRFLIYKSDKNAFIGRRLTLNSGSHQSKWIHLVGTYDATKAASGIDIWINGVEVDSSDLNSGSYPGMTNTGEAISIGGDAGIGGNGFFNGYIDDVIFFNRTLSSDEINALYADAKAEDYVGTFSSLLDGNHTFTAYSQDTLGNVNVSQTRTVTVDTTGPTVSITSPTENKRINNVNIYVNGTATDTVSSIDTIWINDSRFTINGTTSPFSFVNSSLIEDGTISVNISANDTLGNVGSYVRNFTLDTTSPIITVTEPSRTAYNSDIAYAIGCTDDNIHNLSLELINSSNTYLLEYNDTGVSGTLNIAGSISTTTYSDGDYTLNTTCSDDHTNSDISHMKKGKKGESVMIVNDTGAINYNMSMSFVEKDDKATDTPPTLISYMENNDKDTKIHFGMNFTVAKPETKPKFLISVEGTSLKHIDDGRYKGHLIWYPYGTDFEGRMLVNGVEKDYTVQVTMLASGQAEVLIIPTENLVVNDEVEFYFDSIFGLNVVWEEQNLTIDTVAPTFDEIPQNITEFVKVPVNVSINATDLNLDTFFVNDTTNFQINSTGFLQNNTELTVGEYHINVSVNDTANNVASFTMTVTISNRPSSGGGGGGGDEGGSGTSYVKATTEITNETVLEECSQDLPLWNRLTSTCRDPTNSICDDGEIILKDKDCAITMEKIKSGDLFREAWFGKVLSLLILGLFFINPTKDKRVIAILLLVLLAWAFIPTLFSSPDITLNQNALSKHPEMFITTLGALAVILIIRSNMIKKGKGKEK